MLKNFFTLASRNLLKNKAYSAINIFGLALGMAVALLIGLWIWDGLSYNHYHKNHATIAEVKTLQTFNGVRDAGQAVSHPVGIELRTKWTSLFRTVSMATWDETHILALGDKKLNEKGLGVQPEFPAMMSIQMTEERWMPTEGHRLHPDWRVHGPGIFRKQIPWERPFAWTTRRT